MFLDHCILESIAIWSFAGGFSLSVCNSVWERSDGRKYPVFRRIAAALLIIAAVSGLTLFIWWLADGPTPKP